jgi:hypothetical protein
VTRSSVSRIAKRAEKFDPPPFTMPTPGLLSEQIDLIDYRLVMGLTHPEGSPILVTVWDGERFRRFLPEQASEWADQLEATPQADELRPAIDALRLLVKRVGEIVTASIMRQETVH